MSSIKTEKALTAKTEISIRFSEVDSLRVVWHGHYLKYFEDGREAFGKKYEIDYLEVYEHNGYAMPLVKEVVEHKRPLRYGEKAIIETTLVNTPAAKVIFEYKIYRSSDMRLAATGETTQVFLDREGDLSLVVPKFFAAWKKKWGAV